MSFVLNELLCGNILFSLTYVCTYAAVELRSVDHVQAGPTPDSFVYIEGQNMTFVCNATPGRETLDWVVELTGQTTASGALALANDQPRIETEVARNDDNPSNITILNAMLRDSNTTVTCKDGDVGTIIDVLTIYVEGEHYSILHVQTIYCFEFVVFSHFLNYVHTWKTYGIHHCVHIRCNLCMHTCIFIMHNITISVFIYTQHTTLEYK